MAMGRGALARWRAHLEEVLGVDDAAEVLDPFATVEWDQLATKADLLPLRADIEGLRAEVGVLRTDVDGLRREGADLRTLLRETRTDVKELRRDLLRVTAAQFFALAAAVGALVGFA